MGYGIKKHLLDYKKLSYADGDEDITLDNTQELIDCSLGINPYGYSGLIDESNQLLSRHYINRYPEVQYSELKKGLIDYWKDIAQLKDINIKIGNGSMGIIERVNRIFIDEDSRILGYWPQFPDYMLDVECRGGKYDYVLLKSEKNFEFDEEELMASMSPEHKLVYIDNPNNPTGQVIPISKVEEIIKQAKNMNVCVFIDEAYGDYISKDNSAISLVNKYDNLFVARSFSKGFGLAGLRVGYLICGELLSNYYSKVDIPFLVSSPGQYITQLALKDKDFIDACRRNIKAVKEEIINACRKIKVLKTDMEVPIMTLSHPDKNVDLYREFLKRNVLTESGKYFPGLGKSYVRFRVTTDPDKIIKIIKDIEKVC